MGLPGWYISDPDDLQEFPVAGGFDSIEGDEEGDIDHETERGKRWVYKQFSRRIWRFIFRLTDVQKDFFRDLHRAVGGRETPFYFVPDVDASPLEAVLVRKEKDFIPDSAQGMMIAGGSGRFWQYTMELSEEPEGTEVQP